jgi:outer membrane protein assembly factor BamB
MKAPMTFSPRIPFKRAALLACALFACAVPAADAAPWTGFGGDAGRSGNQPVDAGGLPVTFAWERTGTGDRNVKTSMLMTDDRVVYGTDNGVVHFRRLSDGSPVGGADVSAEPAAFGPPGASVGLAGTSTRVFAAHNDASAIQIAAFDTADGELLEQFDVPGTGSQTLASSLLATPPAADGSTVLFFVAGGRLFRVPVSGSGAFGTVTSTADVGATPAASPTLVYLDVLGTPTAHVAIGTTGPALRTYRVSNLAAGPAATALPNAIEVLTPIVPVQPDGRTPSPGGPVDTAPAIYVSATSLIFGPSTKVFKLRQNGTTLEVERDAPFPGEPSPAMAVSQVAEPGMEDGKLALGVGINHFLLSTRDLDVVGSFDTEFDLQGGIDGFQHTTGAVSGQLIFITDDSGRQFVVRLSDGKPITNGQQFSRRPANAGQIAGGAGQPSVSRGHVAFGGPDGVFVYRTTQDAAPPAPAEDTAPTVAFTAPAAGARLSGSPTLSATASDDRGIASVRFLAGERELCTDTTAPYDCAFRLTAEDVGRTTLVAVATDGAGQTAAALRNVTVNRFAPRSVTATTKPSRDARRPFRFTTSGVVRMPAGIKRGQGCGGGAVSVQIKAARKTISTRRARLSRTCTYRSRVTFRSRNRFPKSGRLTVRVRFLGTAVLAPRRAKTATLRTRP